VATVNRNDTMRVFRTMRGKLLEKGVRCGLADSFAMGSVKLYKWCVRRGCTNPFDFVTSDRRVAHYVEQAR